MSRATSRAAIGRSWFRGSHSLVFFLSYRMLGGKKAGKNGEGNNRGEEEEKEKETEKDECKV